jgi:hypothetical protein
LEQLIPHLKCTENTFKNNYNSLNVDLKLKNVKIFPEQNFTGPQKLRGSFESLPTVQRKES